MRRAARTDNNQNRIVQELRDAGVSVEPLHTVGDGVPDLLCGHNGRTYLFEVKDPKKPPSKRKLTPHQIEWHKRWQGQVAVITTAAQALEAMCIATTKN